MNIVAPSAPNATGADQNAERHVEEPLGVEDVSEAQSAVTERDARRLELLRVHLAMPL